VKVTNTKTKASTTIDYEPFLEKIDEMRELYQNFLESGNVGLPHCALTLELDGRPI
jgi:hypothetical protein